MTETQTVRRARKPHRCDGDRCGRTIKPGERYRDFLIYPGHEFLAVDKPTHMRQCADCATSYEPLPAEAVSR